MSQLTHEQIIEMDAYNQFQIRRYGNILSNNPSDNEEFENRVAEQEHEREIIDAYWERELNKDYSQLNNGV